LPRPTLEARKEMKRRERLREQLKSEKGGFTGWIKSTFWPSLGSSPADASPPKEEEMEDSMDDS
jgi:hypothetical protein